MLANLLKDAEDKMNKAFEAVEKDLKTLRTGRATTNMLDGVKVHAYGTDTPAASLATITAPDAGTILIQPWDASLLSAFEKAINQANLGMTPNNDGKVIRLNVPQLNEERRKEIVKQAHAMAEHGRVAVRNVRRHANDEIKKSEKDHSITEDDRKRLTDQVQKKTDDFIKKIDAALKKKEDEIMKV